MNGPHRFCLSSIHTRAFQRYALFLTGYDQPIGYKNTKVYSTLNCTLKCTAMQMAFLGCHLKPKKTGEAVDPVNVFNKKFEPLPIIVENVRRET